MVLAILKNGILFVPARDLSWLLKRVALTIYALALIFFSTNLHEYGYIYS